MSSIGTKAKSIFAAAALGVALMIASPASALQLLNASMDTSNIATITGGVYGEGGIQVYDAPVTFIATDGGAPFSFTAFCVDIYHDMTLGSLNGGAGYAYHEEALRYDSATSTEVNPAEQSGVLLTLTQINKVKALVNFGNRLMKTNASDLNNKLAAVQAGIWQVEYGPAYTITTNSAVASYLNGVNDDFVARAATESMPVKGITTIFADDYARQAFAFASEVPEPTTWLMMIFGFGGIGAVLRRRRQATAFA